MTKYLLSIEELMGAEGRGLLEEAFSKVDHHRRRKAEGLRLGRARAACLGAGLLLQLAVWMFPGQRGAGSAVYSGLIQYTVSGLLDRLRDKEPLPLAFRYGEKGKPYFRDYPFYFNLSHSGDYVLCALSTKEVGADVQQHRAGAGGRIAARYFSEQERAALESCKGGGDELFFRLWTRKEAYGKLTGEGIAGTMGINLLPEACGTDRGGLRFDKGIEVPEIVLGKSKRIQDGRELVWEEYRIPGYSISICRHGKAYDYV